MTVYPWDMSDAMSQAAAWKAEKLERAEAKYGDLSDADLNAEWERLDGTIKTLMGMRDQLDAQINPLDKAKGLVEALLYERLERVRWGRTSSSSA